MLNTVSHPVFSKRMMYISLIARNPPESPKLESIIQTLKNFTRSTIFMAFLSKDHIREMVQNAKLVEGYDDLEAQMTANGFDVRVGAVIEILKAGKLAINKQDNKPPQLGTAWVVEGYEHRLQGYDIKEMILCKPGFSVQLIPFQSYYTITMETINTPAAMLTKIASRTSLFRYTQTILEAGFGEAGYCGFLTFMLCPTLNGAELELGSRFAQVGFAQLTSESHYQSQKESSYQGGKLF